MMPSWTWGVSPRSWRPSAAPSGAVAATVTYDSVALKATLTPTDRLTLIVGLFYAVYRVRFIIVTVLMAAVVAFAIEPNFHFVGHKSSPAFGSFVRYAVTMKASAPAHLTTTHSHLPPTIVSE